MNSISPKILGIVAAIVILLGAGGLLFLNNSKTSTNNTSPSSSPKASSESMMHPQSLFDLLSLSKTQQCTFSYSGDNGEKTNGTVYLEGANLRADISSTTKDNKKSDFSMIRDGDTTYIWGTGLQEGVKMTLSSKDLQTNQQANQYFNTEQKVEYNCQGWTADSTKFTPPTSVKFMDMTSVMNEMKSSSPSSSGNSSACGGCDSLSGQSKTYCLQVYCK